MNRHQCPLKLTFHSFPSLVSPTTTTQALMNAKGGNNFRYSPHIEGYADYVARPLGLMDVTRNLRNGLYDNSVGLFAADVRVLFANCAVFNADNDLITHEADRLVARFDRLFLNWVLDPTAPPVDKLGLDDICQICRETTPQMFGEVVPGGFTEWKVVPLVS